MAGKKNGGEVDFDLDNMDDLDWPDFNFDEAFEEPKDDRNPVSKVAVTGLKAVGKTVADPERIRKALTKTMPGSYSDAVGISFDAASELRGVFDTGMEEVTKTKQDLQRTLRRTLPKVKGKLPDKLGKVLEKLAGEDYSPGFTKSKEQQRSEDIDARLDEIMGAQHDQEMSDREIAEARRLGNEVQTRKRFKTQMAAFSSMDTTLRQLRDYNEGIDARWKRKTLELQMQQSYLLSDLVENTSKASADTLSQLAAIAKNTALPEAAKIVATEEFKRLNQAKLLEQLGQGVYGNLGSYLAKTAKGVRERVTRTVGDKLRNFRSGVRDVADMSTDMMAMQEQAGPDDSLGTLMELGMGAGADWATNRYGDKVKSRLGKLNRFNSRQGTIRNFITNGARWLDEEAGKRNTHDGLKGTLLDMGRSLLHTTRLDGSIRGEDLSKGDMPDNFNRLSNRSLIDIIPGLLSRIHHEVVKFRTGDDKVPMIRYDMSSGTFTDSQSMIRRVKGQLMREGQEVYNRQGLNNILDTIDPEKKLTASQRDVLSRHLVQLNMTNKAFNIRRLANGSDIYGNGSAKDKAAIRQFLADRHGVNADGSLKGSKEELGSHEADIGQMLQAMRYNFADPTGPIKALIDAGYKEELIAAGILANQGGSLSINFDKVTDLRLGEGELGTDYGEKAYSPPTPRGRFSQGGQPPSRRTRKRHSKGQPQPIPTRGSALPAPAPAPRPAVPMGVVIDYKAMGGAVAEAFEKVAPKAADTTPVLDRMDQLLLGLGKLSKNETSEYQTMVLEEIMDILQDGRQNANVRITEALILEGGVRLGTEKDIWKERAKRAGGKVRDRFNSVTGAIGNRLTQAKNKVLNVGRGARDLVAKAGRVLDDFNDQIVDIYVAGWSKPVLEARKLEMGLYRDKLTGKIIRRLSDIKGEVEELTEDGRTRIALSLEDFQKGLHDRLGKRVILSGLKGIRDGITAATDRAFGGVARVKNFVFDKLKSAKDWAWGKLAGLHDVYVKGEDRPRLLKHILEAGGYFDKATGQVISKLSDIKGDVVDANGNLVLSLEEMRKGLVDQYGTAIKANWLVALTRISRAGRQVRIGVKRLWRGAKRTMSGLFKGIKGLGMMAGGALKGLGQRISNLFSEDGYSSDILRAQLEVQVNILDQVSQLNPKNRKRRNGDADGDGDRDGSWQDILANRGKQKKEKAPAAPTKEGEKPEKENPLMKLLAMLLAGKNKLLGGLSSLLGGGADLLGDLLGGGDRPGRGKRGWLGRAWEGAKGLGKRALNSRVGQAALGVAGTAARNLGGLALRGATAAAGLVSAPVLAGAAAVAGVAALGWMAYKWYDRSKSRPLQRLRLAQYGCLGDDADVAKQILSFEERILKHVKVTDGRVNITAGGEDAIEALKELGHDPANPQDGGYQRFMVWYEQRFRPIFSEWLNAMATAKIAEPLNQLDDKCSPENKFTLFKAVRNAGRTTWSVASGPVTGMKMVTDAKQIEAVANEVEKELAKDAPKGVKMAEAPITALPGATAAAAAPAAATLAQTRGSGVGVRKEDAVVMAGVGAIGGRGVLEALGSVASRFIPNRQTRFPAGLYPSTVLDALRTIRMRCYGLVRLDTPMVNAMIYLEWAANQKTKVDSDGNGYYDGKLEELIDQVGPRFSVGEKGSGSYENFKLWLDNRFLPAWTTFAAAVKAAGGANDPLWAHERLKPQDQYQVAEAIIGAGSQWNERYTSIWAIPLHPVMGESANTDSSTIADNMKALIKGIEKQQLDEIAGEKGRAKNSLLSKTKSFFSGIGDSVKKFFGGGDSSSSNTTAQKPGWFSRLFGGGGATGEAPDMSRKTDLYNGGGGTYEAMAGGGVDVNVNFDPKGGKLGNVNDLPMPTARQGFEAHKDLIAAAAKMTGMDAGVLAGILATESNFDSSVKNGRSTATGLGQFIGKTWEYMVRKYGSLFGIKSGTSPNDPRANILMTAMYMKDNMDALKQATGRDKFTDVDLYCAHFLGPGGYAKLLKNPDMLAKDANPDGARSNPTIFFRGGNRNQPVTSRELINIQGSKQVKNRNYYGQLMHAYLRERGEKVDDSIFKQQGGVEATAATTPASAPSAAPGTPAPNTETIAGALPAPNLPGASGGGEAVASTEAPGKPPVAEAPATGPAADQPAPAIATQARMANAGGADIAAAPTAAPVPTRSPVSTGLAKVSTTEAPAPALVDPGAKDMERAAQATAQKSTAADLTGTGVDKLVDLGVKHLEVSKQTLHAILKLGEIILDANSKPSMPPAGPMNLNVPV